MSQFMDKLSIGDTMSFKGPVGQFVYEGRGAYTVNRQRGCTKHLSLVAGGTGITPIYSVMQKALKEPQVGVRMGRWGREGSGLEGSGLGT